MHYYNVYITWLFHLIKLSGCIGKSKHVYIYSKNLSYFYTTCKLNEYRQITMVPDSGEKKQ